MSYRYRKPSGQRGFTLIEATISLTLLLIVLVLSMGFLFSMRNFSQRQEMVTAPRQTARRAVDYVTYYLKRATDYNSDSTTGGNPTPSPNAIVTHYSLGSKAADTLASMNNVTDPNLADIGTDLITLASPPTSPLMMFIARWTGNDLQAANVWVDYTRGCPNDATTLSNFEKEIGWDPVTGTSAILTVYDSQGHWTYYQVTGLNDQSCDCTRSDGEIIHIGSNPGGSDMVNPPGGPGDILDKPVSIVGGLQYYTLRVRNGQLEQKPSIFNPNTDNPGTAFTPILDNVEDLQIAYIFKDGTVENTATQTMTTPGGVPTQSGPTGTAYDASTDITSVIGFRVTVVARSDRLPTTILSRDKYLRPAAEDHPAATTPDRFYHYRLTSTVMLRNRMLGN